jgi:UDP-N-acetylglucosamine 1-carboxyvinyltransferase
MSAHRNRGPRYVVQGGAVLRGRVCVSGAKNHVLAAMCAALLTDEDVTFSNVPDISDVDTLGDLLTSLGAMVERLPGGRLRMNGGGVREFEAPSELITENRASFQVMGPLVARHGFASSAPPGGDVIGQRPLDVHLHGFEAMGAEIRRDGERFTARTPGARRLRGVRIFMDYPSVSGTQNVMMAATLAEGRTTIVNAATEPEVQELALLLNAMGARVSGIGSQMVEVEGVDRLHSADVRIMPDRIEAGTFAIAAAITGGDVMLERAPVTVMDALFAKLRTAGAVVEESGDGTVRVAREGSLRSTSFQALPYPGLATDLHAPMAAMLTQAAGVSIIHERVFDNRMLYVGELRKMGAEIVSTGSSAIVSGPTPMNGAHVRALDVRAGAAVMLAALVATGVTIIDEIHHLDRGYERLDEKLRALGVRLERE